MSLHVIGEEGQESVSHAYKSYVMVHIVGLVKQGKKIQIQKCLDLSSGCHGLFQTTHYCSLIVTLQGPFAIPDVHIGPLESSRP